MHLKRRVSLSLFVGCLTTGSLHPQTADTATLRGRAEDTTHAVIAGAQVTATNGLTGFVRVTVTDGHGRFSLSGLPVSGSYEVSVRKSGFANAETHSSAACAGQLCGTEPAAGAGRGTREHHRDRQRK